MQLVLFRHLGVGSWETGVLPVPCVVFMNVVAPLTVLQSPCVPVCAPRRSMCVREAGTVLA